MRSFQYHLTEKDVRNYVFYGKKTNKGISDAGVMKILLIIGIGASLAGYLPRLFFCIPRYNFIEVLHILSVSMEELVTQRLFFLQIVCSILLSTGRICFILLFIMAIGLMARYRHLVQRLTSLRVFNLNEHFIEFTSDGGDIEKYPYSDVQELVVIKNMLLIKLGKKLHMDKYILIPYSLFENEEDKKDFLDFISDKIQMDEGWRPELEEAAKEAQEDERQGETGVLFHFPFSQTEDQWIDVWVSASIYLSQTKMAFMARLSQISAGLCAGIAVTIAAGYQWRNQPLLQIFVPVCVWILLTAFYYYRNFSRRIYKTYLSNLKKKGSLPISRTGKQAVTITEQHVLVSTAMEQWSMPISRVYVAVETKEEFFLLSKDRSFVNIPLSAFPSSEDRAGLEAFITRKGIPIKIK